MVTGLPRRSTVRITAGSHVVCSTLRQLPVLSICSLSQTQREKSIPDAAFSMGARHKNSIRSQLFFADMCKRRAPFTHPHACSACAHREKNVRQQGNVSADFLHLDHCPVRFWRFPCHFMCAFAKKVHKNTKNMLF